jgi:6,7-dimethyl-8-ribityllumazine synthase
VVEHLLEGAIDTLKRHGVSEDAITVFMHRVHGNSQLLQKISGI